MSSSRARFSGHEFVLYALLAMLVAPVAYYTLFATPPLVYDDEGYFLVSIKLVASGQRLYDDVLTGYGPAYYLFFVPISKLIGGIGHDDGRWIVLALWLAGCWTSAVGVRRLTGSLLVSATAFLLTFKIGAALAAEPMNPAALLNVLLLGTVVCATYVRSESSALKVLAVLVMLAGLIKINIGAYAGIALVFALLAGTSRQWPRAYWIGGFALLCLFPAILLARDIGHTKSYLFLVVASGAAVVAGSSVGPRPAPDLRQAWAGVLLALVGTVVVVAVLAMVAFGTTPAGLWDGTVGLASNSSDVFALFKTVTLRPTFLTLLLIPPVIRAVRTGAAPPPWMSALRMGVGLLLLALVLWKLAYGAHGFLPVEWILPCAWLAALPDPRPDAGAQLRFARVFAAALAVTQSLYAYPVAGTQRAFASVMVVAVGAISFADGARMLTPHVRRWTDQLRAAHRISLGVAGLALIVWSAALVELRWVRTVYNNELSLNAPGAQRLHGDDDLIDRIKWVRANTRGCSTFIPVLGLNSMYLWTEKPPPAFMQQVWPNSLSRERQAKIVSRLRNDPRACVLVNRDATQFWTRGYKLRPGPLVDFAHKEFRRAAKSQWTDEVWVRKT